MRAGVGAAVGWGVAALAVARALERSDVPAPALALVAGTAVVAIAVREAPFGREIALLAFLFCAVPAARLSFPLGALGFSEQNVHVRPAVALLAVCLAVAARQKNCAREDGGAAVFVPIGAAGVAFATAAGYLWLSRHYNLEWPVLREAILNGLIFCAGYFVLATVAASGGSRRLTLVPMALALVAMAGLQWARGD